MFNHPQPDENTFGPASDLGGLQLVQQLFSTKSGFSIEGPSQAKIDCKDNGDGSADITYWPTAPGEYAVHILCREEDIPKSPYMADIIPAGDYDPSKVRRLELHLV